MANLEIKTATRYIEVFLDGVFVSRHLTVEDAIESAVNRGNGDYRIVYPERLVKVYGILNPLTGDTQAPTVPGNPQLVSKGATFVTLSWAASTDNIGVTGYQIRRNGVPAGTTVSTSYTNSGLTPSTQYSYTVEAYDAAGNNSGTTGQTPLVTTTNANSAPVWNAPQQELTTNVSYNLTLTSVCSDADGNPITFAQVSGTLPTGVAFNAGSGIVSGTPTTVQSPSVTFSASDGIAAPVNQAIVFNVLNPDVTAPNVPTLNTPTSVTSSSMTVTANATTDPTVANARTSGVATYTLQRATDSGFTTGVVTESPQAGTTWNLTGLSASTQYWFRARATDAAGNVSAYGSSVNATTSATSFSYTPSHYVAPFASVSGASNDYTDLGATSWANATNSGTPTTLGTAMARATSSNGLLGLAAKVRCAPGVYYGLVSGANKIPVFRPSNSGTSGNPIIFFAQYPAATNYGQTSLYSELRTNGTLSTGSTASPAIGVNGQDYVIFDGFFTKFSTCIPAPSGGTAGLADCVGCEVRRFAVVCDVFGINTSYPGYNGNHLFAEQAHSSAFRDNYLIAGSSVHHNDAQCQLYGCRPFSIVNNTFDAGDYKHGPFVKGSSPTPTSQSTANNNVTISYNRVNGSILVGNCDTAEIHHNLILHNQNTGRQSAMMTYSDWRDLRWYNNTVVMGGATPYVMTFWNVATGLTPGTSARIYDNIIVNSVSPYNMILFNDGDMVVGTNAQIATWWDQIDGNVYWSNGNNPRFTDGAGTAVTGIANWRTRLTAMGMVAGARETNSIVANPSFVDAAGGNYRLNGGSSAAGKGCYVTGSEEIGVRANPSY